MTVRLGLLSTARINREILAAAAESDDADVVAVASRDRARAEAYARAHGIARAHGSYEELLADLEVDVVYNSLPNALHVPWSARALQAGKHVLCEKPLSRRPDEVEELFDLAASEGLVVQEAFMYRHHPQSARIAELVRGGVIGRLRSVYAAFSFLLTDPGNIRMSGELDGGALMDVGCYCVSGSRLVAGEPERLSGEQIVAESGVDVAFHGTMRFPDDVVAQFEASFAAPRRQRLEAIGEAGRLVVEAPWRPDWGGDVLLHRDREVEHVEVPEANAYRLEVENLAAAIRGEREPLLGREDAVTQARAIAALYRAAGDGRTVVV
ncbi:MAG: Gfo/Idh/MocA family oxidoreductase [Actinomycetota bacterium]|nr:Gfo/Idh/MocA family oxidoreductase [Actinomycetota bacterium]